MPQRAWSDKRERQYEHIKEGLRERGTGEEKAEEIAARTVNKERARHGETMEASRTSIREPDCRFSTNTTRLLPRSEAAGTSERYVNTSSTRAAFRSGILCTIFTVC